MARRPGVRIEILTAQGQGGIEAVMRPSVLAELGLAHRARR
jgi:hypothetical protein